MRRISKKEHILYSLHHSAKIYFLLSVLTMTMFFSHPINTVGLFLVVLNLIIQLKMMTMWIKSIKYLLYLSVLIFVVNVLFVNTGVTVLYRSEVIPIIGSIQISLESLVYSLMMIIKLITVVSVFIIGNEIMDSDQSIKMFARWGRKPVLMIILSTRLYPLMKCDYERIAQIQRNRGLNINEGNIIQKVKKRVPLINTTLLSSLERAFEIAESMHARGYGIGKGSLYKNTKKRPRDYIVTLSIFCAMGLMLVIYLMKISRYNYYPKLSLISMESIMFQIALSVLLLVPLFLDWGMKKWQRFRLKI